MIDVETITDPAAFASIAETWEQLEAESPAANLFNSAVFSEVWWKYFGAGRKLRLTLVRSAGRLIGLAPMAIQKERYSGLPVRTLTFLRNKHVSRSDVLAAPGHEQAVAGALAKHWQKMKSEWDVLRLLDVPASCGTLRYLAREFEQNGIVSYPIEESRRLWSVPLSGTWEEYIGNHSRKFRKNLNLYNNRVARRSEIRVARNNTPDEVHQSMGLFYELQQRSWKADADGAFQNEVDQAFGTELARRLAERGGFENLLMIAGEKAIGGLHSLIYRGAYYSMLVVYDQSEEEVAPGRYIIGMKLKESFGERKGEVFDFNGDSEFVQSWATKSELHENLSACNGGMYSKLISGFKTMKRLMVARPVGSL